ncbi:SBBP repeat-containing protein [Leptospira bouyouniensis]|nr:SBBP repeat-containing protein [Leptospira bouyouniensis]
MKEYIQIKVMRKIPIYLLILFLQFISLNCKPVELNNSSDIQSKSFVETQILKCMLSGWDCIEFPQNNQGIKQWSKIIGQSGTYQSYGNSTAVDRKGNVYLIGTTSGSVYGQNKISPSSMNDILLTKFAQDGQLIWAKQMGSIAVSSTYAELAHIDSSGNLYVVGSANSPFNELGSIGAGAILIKLSGSGNLLWTRMIPTASETLGAGVTSDYFGNVYITGNTEEQLLNGQTATGGRNTFVLKYNSLGDLVWTKLFDNTGISSYGQNIQYEATTQSILVAGQISGGTSFFGKTPPGNLTDSYIVSLDLNGNFKWAQVLGGITISTQIRTMSVDQKGSIYVSGDTNGNLDGIVKDGSTVQFLTKLNVFGEKIWTRLLGGGGSSLTYAYGVYSDNSGNVYTFGGTNGNLIGIPKIGTNDAHLTKYDSNGNLIWIRLSGNNGIELSGRGISADRFGTLYVSGFTSGGFDGQAKLGTFDAFLIQYY